MKQLFVIGGKNEGCKDALNTILKYDVKRKKWSRTASMKDKRIDAACSIFAGKIVVSGGEGLKSVEAFDHHENKWICLPDMLEIRKDHGIVSFTNKLFAIAGSLSNTCEVFDNCTKMFTYIKPIPSESSCFPCPNQVLCLDKVIVVISSYLKSDGYAPCYDTQSCTWHRKHYDYLRNYNSSASYLKCPQC